MGVSTSVKFWEKVIEQFYGKYKKIQDQHILWMQEATTTGQLVMPTGRIYKFKPYLKVYKDGNSDLKWPRTTILNYPVQGLGADIVSIARVSLANRLRNLDFYSDVKLISTVHDSIIIDTYSKHLGEICRVVNDMFNNLPDNFSRLFGCEFNLPLSGEISYGPNLKDLTKIP